MLAFSSAKIFACPSFLLLKRTQKNASVEHFYSSKKVVKSASVGDFFCFSVGSKMRFFWKARATYALPTRFSLATLHLEGQGVTKKLDPI